MRKKKKIFNAFDVGRIAITEAMPQAALSLAQYEAPKTLTLERFLFEEKQAELKKQKAKEDAEHQKVKTENNNRVRGYWSKPAVDLMNDPVGVRDDFSELEVGPSDPRAGQNFIEELRGQGIPLTTAAKQRIGKYIESQSAHAGAAITVANLRKSLNRLNFLGCFATGEISQSEVAAPEPQAPESEPQAPSLDTLIAVSGVSQEADRAAKRALHAEVVGTEFAAVWEEWSNHLQSQYGYTLKKYQHQAAWDMFQGQNLSPLRRENYDLVRKALVSRGILPPALLSARDVLEKSYRAGEISSRDFLQQCQTLERSGLVDRPRAEAGI